VNTQEQLAWEARFAKPAAVSAFLAAVLIIAGTVVRQVVALSDRPDDEREFLIAIDDKSGAFIASAFIQSLSFIFLAVVLFYLYSATKARKPEFPVIAVVIAVLGPLLLAVAGPLSDLSRLDIADEFLSSGPQTNKRAEDLLEDRSVSAAAVGSAGTLALAIAFVLININAMRVGLLSRFMGIIGAIIGGLYVLPILSGPLIVQLFWLVAIGPLFLGHWPGGRGPAWSTAEAVPWPTGAELRAKAAETVDPPDASDAEPADEPAAPRKRKRKKRR
jgi:Domain of unknown function (DUF4386)